MDVAAVLIPALHGGFPLALRWRWPLTVTILAAVLAGAISPAIGAPLTIKSATGRFFFEFTGIDPVETLNHMHGFHLQLTTPSGEPINGAVIVLTGARHDSDNPLPTMPQITATGLPGRYRGEGLRFHMPGDWRLTFAIVDGTVRDRASVDVTVR